MLSRRSPAPLFASLLLASVLATAGSARTREVLSPRDMALALEAEAASGAGALLPDPGLEVVLGPVRATIPPDGAGWPQDFLSALDLSPFDPDAGAWRVSTTFDPDTGNVEFRDASGALFWTECPDEPVSFNWIAPFRRPTADPSPDDALHDPARIRLEWLLGPEDQTAAALRISPSAPLRPLSLLPPPGQQADGGGPLRWTAFRPVSNRYETAVAWPATNLQDFSAIDVLCKHRLEDPRWRWIWRHQVSDPSALSAAFPIPENAVPAFLPPDEPLPATTNVVLSPFGVVYTNVIHAATHAAARQHSAFFLAASVRDTDGDGLTDAVETHCLGTDPSLADTDGDTMPDAWETLHGLDPLDPLDAISDADADGLPNVYEFHCGCDPHAPDYADAPRIVAGGSGTNSAPTLAAALAAAPPYGMIEIAPGVRSGPGWTEIDMPETPVLVTTGNGGRSRASRIRHTGSNIAAFFFEGGQTSHTVIQGLTVELAGTGGYQAAFWLGGNLPTEPGPGAAATFKNVRVLLGAATTPRTGWFFRHSAPGAAYFAGCSVDAAGCASAVGVCAVDSPDLVLENCTFTGFPSAEDGRAYAVMTESTDKNTGNARNPVDVLLRNCLFDASFTNALAIAPLTNGVAYRTRMESCLLPSPPEYPATESDGTVFAAVETGPHGHLLPGCPAIGAGRPVLVAAPDIDGEDRGEAPDIGADEWTDGQDADPDGDGLANAAEFILGTDPFLADTDGDGLPDAEETAEGTDPLDPGSFCFSLSGTAAFSAEVPANALLAVVKPDFTAAFAAAPVAGTNAAVDFRHVVVSDCPAPVLALFSDTDGDGLPGAFENAARSALPRGGHERTVEAAFGPVAGDFDGDGLPDAWERARGLSWTNALDALEDPDGDGLANLHEWWHGLEPFVADGSNTVISALVRSVDGRIAGKDPATALPVYVDYLANAATNAFVRNPDCWAAGIDFSCASPWHSGPDPSKMASTLISPRHVIMATHYKPDIGTAIRFLGTDGVLYSRTLVSDVSDTNATDMSVGLLDSPLPATVTPATFLPPDWADYIGNGLNLPVVSFDQEEKLIIHEIASIHDNGAGSELVGKTPGDTMRAAFSELAVPGDSGNPRFLLLENRPLLISTFHKGYGGYGPYFPELLDTIQSLMDELLPGYSVSVADLSAFPTITR